MAAVGGEMNSDNPVRTKHPVRLLIIESEYADFLLIERHLRTLGVIADFGLVSSVQELDVALQSPWDVVLSDYTVPGMDFSETLQRIQTHDPDLPIILVSRSIGEEAAVHLLHLGLSDFVLKDSLVRLFPAIERAQRTAKEHLARRAAEAKLADRDFKLEAIIGYSPSALSMKRTDGRYVLANPNVQHIHHLTEEELIGKTDFDLYPADTARTFAANDALVLSSMGRNSIEEVIPVDGMPRTFMSHMFPVVDETGDAKFICRISLDIHDAKAAQLALRQSEAKFRLLTETAGDWIFWIGPDGHFIYVSPACARISGYEPAEFLGNPDLMAAIIHPDDRSLFERMHEADMSSGSCFGDFRIIHKDGTVRWLGHYCHAIHDDEGAFLGRGGSNVDITARKHAESEHRVLSEALRQSPQALLLADPNTVITYINPAFSHLFGYRPEELVGKSVRVLVPGSQADQVTHSDVVAQVREVRSYSFEADRVARDGALIPVLVNIGTIADDRGVTIGMVASFSDLRSLRENESMLRKLSLAVDQSPASVIITGLDGKIEYVNDTFVHDTGYSRTEAIGRNPRFLRSGKTPRETYESLWCSLNKGEVWRGEFINRRKDGSEYPDAVTIAPLRQSNGKITHYVALQEDITERRRTEEQIKDLAFYDPLTRLPNRRLLIDRLKQSIASGVRSKRDGALMFIDLDNFKTLNDTFGHATGDKVLEQVGKRLSSCVREGDTVARLGGDEFVVMLDSLSDSAHEAAAKTKAVGEKILAAIGQPLLIGDLKFDISASIGATLFGENQSDIGELLMQADIGMYQAKSAGRNRLRFFDPDLQASVKARSVLETDLRKGIVDGELRLYFQPQVDHLGQWKGAEVLVRWQHPDRGMVSPADFIPLAEESGLILPVGDWVMNAACAQLAAWTSSPRLAGITIAVNVSARQFQQPDFVDQVMAALDRAKVEPSRLKLELTESLLVENTQDIIAKMSALQAMGVAFSLDDFGTGYSSLSYLKLLPLAQLKIDQSFVRDVLTDPNDAVIAKAIVALAHSLGLDVIAEGVETQAQMDFLSGHGCHAYQGYLFSRPVPLDQFEALAEASSAFTYNC